MEKTFAEPLQRALLAQVIDQMPAGGDGFFAVVGIVFVILLILELVGAIDIFKKFP